MTTEQTGQAAHEVTELLRHARQDISRNFLTIGQALDLVIKEKLFLAYGANFNQYLNEIGYKRAWAYGAIRVFRKFGSFPQVGKVDHSRLVKLLPLTFQNEDIPAWLEKAATLPASGFNDEVAIARGKQPRETCQHPETYTITLCKCCGMRIGRTQ